MPETIARSSLTFEAILDDLHAWVESVPENARWQDFQTSGAGETLTQLLAGLGAYDAFHALMARREVDLDLAVQRSSLVSLANILGYPVCRKSAPKLRLSVESTLAVDFWDKVASHDEVAGGPIGSYQGLDLCLVQSQAVGQGSITLDVFVGNWKTLEVVSGENKNWARVYVEDPDVDNNSDPDPDSPPRLELTLDGEPVSLTAYPELLDPTNVLVRTLPDGVLLLFGDGVQGVRLYVQDLVFNYVATAGALSSAEVLPTEVQTLFGTVTEVEVLSVGSGEDSIEKIRVVAPGYHAARRAMVTAADHQSIALGWSGSLVSVNARKKPSSYGVVEMVYLFDDEHEITSEESAAFLMYLEQFQVAGETIELVAPTRVGLEMVMTLEVTPVLQGQNVQSMVQDIVDGYVMQLGGVFQVGRIIDDIASIDGVRRVYMQTPVSDRSNGYAEYIAVDSITVTVTTNSRGAVTVSPSDDGYVTGT